MIKIGHDKLYSMSEILANAKIHIKNKGLDDEAVSYIATGIAIALEEDVDFALGAIKNLDFQRGLC